MARDGIGWDRIWIGWDYIWYQSLYIQKQARIDHIAPENTGTGWILRAELPDAAPESGMSGRVGCRVDRGNGVRRRLTNIRNVKVKNPVCRVLLVGELADSEQIGCCDDIVVGCCLVGHWWWVAALTYKQSPNEEFG